MQTFKVEKKKKWLTGLYILVQPWMRSPSNISLQAKLENVAISSVSDLSATFRGIVLDGLFERRDVAEGAEKQDHLLLFIPNGSDLHKKPDRRP